MGDYEVNIPVQSVAFIGPYLPRVTRLSALNTAVCQTFAGEFCDCDSTWVGVSDAPARYAYPARVRFEVLQSKPETYLAAVDYLKLKKVQAICVAYDPGLFAEGLDPLVALLANLSVPVIIWTGDIALNGLVLKDINRLAGVTSCVLLTSQEDRDWLAGASEIQLEKNMLTEVGATRPADSESDLKVTARAIMEGFQKALNESARRTMIQMAGLPIPVTGSETSGPHSHTLPELKLDHFLRMTDETGILHASVYSLPDYQQGYTTQDNARALMFSLMLQQVAEGPFIPVDMQAARHLAFLYSAFNTHLGRFRERLSYTHIWQDEVGSEECHGLAVWAMGMALGRSQSVGIKQVAGQLFEAALPVVNQFSSLRAWAFVLLGIQEYLRRFSGDRSVQRTGRILLERLMQMYRERATEDWPWFEDDLSEGSVCLSQALIASAQWANREDVVQTGLKTLGWLSDIQFEGGKFSPVGDAGYSRRDGQRARFAQRPVEARGMVSACLEAYRVTGGNRWLENARAAFQWFLGRNDLGQSLYNPEIGGCCDSLSPGIASSNYSAEALLSFLLAQLEMRLFDQLYHQRTTDSSALPILQIALPAPSLHSEE